MKDLIKNEDTYDPQPQHFVTLPPRHSSPANVVGHANALYATAESISWWRRPGTNVRTSLPPKGSLEIRA